MASADVKATNETVQPMFMSTKQVLAYLNLSASTLYSLMSKGLFRRPVKCAGKNLWPRDYVEGYAASLVAEFHTSQG